MRTKRDKIFDNTFDDGGDFELNGTISFNLNPQYTDNRDEEDKIESTQIRNKIHELIEASRFKKFNEVDEFQQITKLRKLDINEVYGFMYDELSAKFSIIDLFSELCDYFNINPTKFYSSLSNKYKEALIQELDKKTNVLKRKNINKLF